MRGPRPIPPRAASPAFAPRAGARGLAELAECGGKQRCPFATDGGKDEGLGVRWKEGLSFGRSPLGPEGRAFGRVEGFGGPEFRHRFARLGFFVKPVGNFTGAWPWPQLRVATCARGRRRIGISGHGRLGIELRERGWARNWCCLQAREDGFCWGSFPGDGLGRRRWDRRIYAGCAPFLYGVGQGPLDGGVLWWGAGPPFCLLLRLRPNLPTFSFQAITRGPPHQPQPRKDPACERNETYLC